MPAGASPEEVLDHLVRWVGEEGLSLYPHQEEALLELLDGAHVILGTPTGSGKSLVALGAHLAALADGRRSWYTAPIKALVSEKFFALVDLLGAEQVGMLTGDAAVNPDAPVICATAEVLANTALRLGRLAPVQQVVMDEFHSYADPDRGWAWQVPLLELPHAQFLLMSATLGDVSFFAEDLTRRTGVRTAVVDRAERPVPLHFSYAMTPVHETVAEVLACGDAPVYLVHPTQAAAVERAQALLSVPLTSREQQRAIADAMHGVRFAPGFGPVLARMLRHGVGVHHAGMLPRYRRLVERLTQAGRLPVVCGTDTLGVGVNVPIRTVLITSLAKYDGRRMRVLKAREFHQIAGRAGRAGFDVFGRVVVQAPEHDIENARALAKAGDDPRLRRKVVRRKPPPGTVSWNHATYERLLSAPPEPLVSRFEVTHGMLLSLIARPVAAHPESARRPDTDPAFAAMCRLLQVNHEPPQAYPHHVRAAIAKLRGLLAARVVERLPEPDADGRRLRLLGDLQADFALHQPLSLFAVAALDLLDPDDPGYAFDVLSVVEAVLEDPRPVLAAQERQARGEAVAAMKAEGLDYEERMTLLDDVTYPRPLADLLETAYDAYAQGHPWVSEHPLRPKSVARDCAERGATFREYVSAYGLARVEGVLLRYLADAAKALRQTVPEELRTEELVDLIAWLTELVRQTDQSLLEEWQARLGGAPAGVRPSDQVDAPPPPVTANVRAFRVIVRNALFHRVQLAARGDWTELGTLDGDDGWTATRWSAALEPFLVEHGAVDDGPAARGPRYFLLDEQWQARRWRVRQVLRDPEDHGDWAITAEIPLDEADIEGVPVVRVQQVGRLDGVG